MIIGTTIAPGQTTRTSTFPRQADNAIFRVEEIGGQGAEGLTIKLFHKTEEETSWTDYGTNFSGGKLEAVNLKSQLCIQFSMSSESFAIDEANLPMNVEPSDQRVRVLPPQWYSTAS